MLLPILFIFFVQIIQFLDKIKGSIVFLGKGDKAQHFNLCIVKGIIHLNFHHIFCRI